MIDVVQIPYGNAGGHLAHIGGAILGFYYVKQLKNGKDIGKPFRILIELLINNFKKKPKIRAVYRKEINRKKIHNTSVASKNQKRIDEILDKISLSGYESLTQNEKDFLYKSGKN